MKSARGTSPVTAQQPADSGKVLKLDRWENMKSGPRRSGGDFFMLQTVLMHSCTIPPDN